MSEHLTITIAGPAASGKTTAAFLIRQALQEIGMEVTISAHEISEVESRQWGEGTQRYAEEALRGRPVVVKTVQTQRKQQ